MVKNLQKCLHLIIILFSSPAWGLFQNQYQQCSLQRFESYKIYMIATPYLVFCKSKIGKMF